MATVSQFEVPSGAIDGLNTVFVVSKAYQPLSVAVFINGQLQNKLSPEGWVETNPVTGVVTLNTAPTVGATVQIFFISSIEDSDTVEVSPLIGRVEAVDDLVGRYASVQELSGKLSTS